VEGRQPALGLLGEDRPVSRLALVLVALAVTAAGCTIGPGPDRSSDSAPDASTTAQAPEQADQPVPPPPAVGACRRLTLLQAARPSNASPRVACRRSHTAYTLHVGRLGTTRGGRPLTPGSGRAQRRLASSCLPRLAAVGGTPEQRRLSRFQVVWFSPTPAQADAGARWFRCDLVALGDSHRLLPLPAGDRVRGVLGRPGALGTYGLCGSAQPGSPGFERVACALRHRWVAIRTLPLRGGRSYPGVARVRSAGDETCADLVRARNGFPLEFSYGWEWPTRAQWRGGQHFGFCWAPNDLARPGL
jgi:hypothetical protein